MNKRVWVSILLFFFIANAVSNLYLNVAKAQTPTSQLDNANYSLNQAFANVLSAEQAGGNVTQLLSQLNAAGDLLTTAQNEYSAGNSTNLSTIVNNAILISNQVSNDALKLREASLVAAENSFWLTLIFSIIGAIFFSLSLLYVWRRFKRAYYKKLLGSKPEVVDNPT